ncbi:hypothetical protein AYO40_04725 [Planctomycetaceae bacterium SCGC AG-212-D15]|nr:hypothetical protein AYO40_04725 [Planctomycetaceae bacterium SCGC AG-212-D15]
MDVSETQVTEAGVKAVKKRLPGFDLRAGGLRHRSQKRRIKTSRDRKWVRERRRGHLLGLVAFENRRSPVGGPDAVAKPFGIRSLRELLGEREWKAGRMP